MMAYGFAAICAPAMILSATFFRYWIGADFAAVAAPVAQVLFPGHMDVRAFPSRFHSPAKPGQSRRDGQIEHRSSFCRLSAILWSLTIAFGIVGAAAAWSLRCAADALVMLWFSGMKRGDFLLLLPPAALLVASLVIARFLEPSILISFPVATFIGAASLVLGYLFSEDWRRLTLAQVNRARVVLGNLTASQANSPRQRAKMIFIGRLRRQVRSRSLAAANA